MTEAAKRVVFGETPSHKYVAGADGSPWGRDEDIRPARTSLRLLPALPTKACYCCGLTQWRMKPWGKAICCRCFPNWRECDCTVCAEARERYEQRRAERLARKGIEVAGR